MITSVELGGRTLTETKPRHIGPFEAMEHLFALWLPRWRLAIVGGQAPPSYEEEWTSTPSLAEVSDYGKFPLTFADPDVRRHPVAVERFDIYDPDETSDSPLHASWGLPEAGAEKTFEFLIEALESGPAVWTGEAVRLPGTCPVTWRQTARTCCGSR